MDAKNSANPCWTCTYAGDCRRQDTDTAETCRHGISAVDDRDGPVLIGLTIVTRTVTVVSVLCG